MRFAGALGERTMRSVPLKHRFRNCFYAAKCADLNSALSSLVL